MPAYNCEKYIEAAIRSVMAQTYTDWELIVLDDGSGDGTREIIECLAAEDERIRPMPNEKNMGVAKTRNRGIDNSRGEFIALLDSDDIWHSDKLDLQIKKMQADNADLCYCSYAIIDSDGIKVKEDYKVPESVDFKVLLRENYIGCSTVIISKKVLNERRFMTDYYHEDYVLWLELLRDGIKAAGCVDVLAEWRLIRNSRSFDKRRSASNRWDIYRKHLGLSRIHSLCLFVAYAFNGIKKYLK